MSILFDGTNDYADTTGTPPLTSGACSIACWYKSNDTGAQDCLVTLGVSASIYDSYGLFRGSDNSCLAKVRDASTSTNATSANTAADTNWHHYCATFVSSTERYSYLDGDDTNRGSNVNSRTPSQAFTQYRVGLEQDNTSDTTGYIAHIAVWSVALSTSEVASLAAGANPLTVQNGNLVWYIPTLVNEDPMQDRVASYDLNLQADAAYNATNPTVDPETTTYLKMLVHPSAIGQVITEGIVLAESTSSPLTIVGDKIGEFVGGSPQYTFVDGSGLSPATDAGYAVLKIPVADFGGGALTTSNTPFAVARNASYTTGLVACTVVEE